jgi:hypothetical protein
MKGAISFPGEALVEANWFGYPILMGIQAIPNGDTPLTLPADIGDSQFLQVEAWQPENAFATWEPNTATAAAIGGGKFSLTWAGQAYYAGTTDFLFTTGLQTGGSETFLIALSTTIWYT